MHAISELSIGKALEEAESLFTEEHDVLVTSKLEAADDHGEKHAEELQLELELNMLAAEQTLAQSKCDAAIDRKRFLTDKVTTLAEQVKIAEGQLASLDGDRQLKLKSDTKRKVEKEYNQLVSQRPSAKAKVRRSHRRVERSRDGVTE